MLGFRDRKTVESSDGSDDDDDEGEAPTSPTTIRTKHDLMMKTEVWIWVLSVENFAISYLLFRTIMSKF